MRMSAVTTLAFLGAVSAQNTTAQLWLIGFDEQSLVGEVIGMDASATVYSIACGDPNDDCGVPTSFTFTQGPSTLHYSYTIADDGEGDNETMDLGCVVTNSISGVCSITALGSASSSATSSIDTTSFTNASDLNAQVVTITAGAVASSANTASATITSSSTTSSPNASSPNASSSNAPSSTKTGASGSTATPTTSSSTSTGGVPKITGNTQWVVGGAAAALAFAAI